VNFKPSHFFPGKESNYLLNKKLDGHQSLYGRLGKEKNPLPLPGLETRTVQPVAYSLYRRQLYCGSSDE
jgi:hypothetical protein